MDVWNFLSDPRNREILGGLGGWLVVLACGAWAAIRFFASDPRHRVTSRIGVTTS